MREERKKSEKRETVRRAVWEGRKEGEMVNVEGERSGGA